jgi:hypothetical protein
MTINFVPKGSKDLAVRVETSLEFETADGETTAVVYLDHIAVGYFSNDGAFVLLPLEVGPGFTNGGEIEDVNYLEERGFKLDKQPHRWGKQDYYEYFISIER